MLRRCLQNVKTGRRSKTNTKSEPVSCEEEQVESLPRVCGLGEDFLAATKSLTVCLRSNFPHPFLNVSFADPLCPARYKINCLFRRRLGCAPEGGPNCGPCFPNYEEDSGGDCVPKKTSKHGKVGGPSPWLLLHYGKPSSGIAVVGHIQMTNEDEAIQAGFCRFLTVLIILYCV